MSQQWLYPIFRLYGYRPTRMETDERCLRLHLEPQPHKVCCPQCGSREIIRRGEQVRALRNLPVGGIVANVTRRDVREFLELAAQMQLRPQVQEYPLAAANQALLDLKAGPVTGAKVLVMD